MDALRDCFTQKLFRKCHIFSVMIMSDKTIKKLFLCHKVRPPQFEYIFVHNLYEILGVTNHHFGLTPTSIATQIGYPLSSQKHFFFAVYKLYFWSQVWEVEVPFIRLDHSGSQPFISYYAYAF